MEPDISILRKTGHFYFALTRTDTNGTHVRNSVNSVWIHRAYHRQVNPMPD